MKISSQILLVLFVVLTIALRSLLFGLPLMFLWNWLMPSIFGLVKIGFLKSIGLILLCELLIKSVTTINYK